MGLYAKMGDMKRGSQGFRRAVLTVASVLEIAIMLFTPAIVLAQQASSTNYSVNEAFFGTGGQLCDPGVSGNSTNYCAKSSVGETGVGNTSSTSYQAQGGFNTNREEYLEFKVTSGSTNLGVLSSSTAATANGTFSVKTYLSNAGYAVINASAPPSSGSHTLTPISPSFPTANASSPGTEQFGINVVLNQTSCPTPAPANYGADPVQVPSSTFSFGVAASGYNTCGKYRYVNGETIASAPKSTGETDYTISYLFNISPATQAGQYTFNHVLVATSTF
jgi:hypothetical protein